MAEPLTETQTAEVAEIVTHEIERFARLLAVELASFEHGPLAQLAPTAKVWRALDNALRRYHFEEVAS